MWQFLQGGLRWRLQGPGQLWSRSLGPGPGKDGLPAPSSNVGTGRLVDAQMTRVIRCCVAAQLLPGPYQHHPNNPCLTCALALCLGGITGGYFAPDRGRRANGRCPVCEDLAQLLRHGRGDGWALTGSGNGLCWPNPGEAMQGGHATRDDLGVRAAAAPPGTVTERDEAQLTGLPPVEAPRPRG